MSLKRRIYGWPALRFYRKLRAAQVASKAVKTSYGFRFAGDPVYLDPNFESNERSLISSVLPNVTAFIDVGANHGIFSCIAAQSGVHVAAIEPEEGNLRVLKSNLSQFASCELFPIAVSDRPGVLSLYGDGDTASLRPGWVGTARSFRQTVVANTLDNLFATRWPGSRLFIKIDVEGAEDSVIAGAGELIHRTPRPYWLIETFPGAKRDRILETFRTAGYDIHAIEWFNFLCTDDPNISTEPVTSMRFGTQDLSFEKTFDPPVSAWEAMEAIVSEARIRGHVFFDDLTAD